MCRGGVLTFRAPVSDTNGWLMLTGHCPVRDGQGARFFFSCVGLAPTLPPKRLKWRYRDQRCVERRQEGLSGCLAGAPKKEYRRGVRVLVQGSSPVFGQNELLPRHPLWVSTLSPSDRKAHFPVNCCSQSTH